MNNLRNFDELRLESAKSNAARLQESIINKNQGQDAPSTEQIASVLYALADHTHNLLMVSPDFIAHGNDFSDVKETQHATALGRYFQYLADELKA
jgi:hypothetical protein